MINFNLSGIIDGKIFAHFDLIDICNFYSLFRKDKLLLVDLPFSFFPLEERAEVNLALEIN